MTKALSSSTGVADSAGMPVPPDRITARMQEISRAVAFDPTSWSPGVANEVRAIFDARAENWYTHETDAYLASLASALDSAGIGGGTCLDIGTGTAIHEATLAARFERVLAVDFSPRMLAWAKRGSAVFVQADAARLPFTDSSVDTIVCVNMFLFAVGYARVLKRDGTLVFVSTRAQETPIYLDPNELGEAMASLVDPAFEMTTGSTGQSCWSIVRRTRATDTTKEPDGTP